VNPIIPTIPSNTDCLSGGSAAAAGDLIKKLGGELLGFVFILELDFMKGREKLPAPVYTLLSSEDEAKSKPA
jgi:adenine phosphoribosyltransferase